MEFRDHRKLVLLTKELRAPNGIAFSPPGFTLYVSNADAEHPVWTAWGVRGDGTLGGGPSLLRRPP
jgi:gluconolactonase